MFWDFYTIFSIIFAIFTIAYCLYIRLKPIILNSSIPCDAYYFMMCREEFRGRRNLPIKLERIFTLEDQKQWYPPGFSVFLSLIPDKIFKRFHWVISPVVDTLICATLMFYCFYLGESLFSSILIALYYASSQSSVAETRALTSRQLGSLLFFVCTLSVYRIIMNPGELTGYIILGLFFLLLIITHKLSTQAFIPVILTGVLVEWTILIPLLVGILVAIIFFNYINIFKCHFGYISFWKNNQFKMGAHQVYGSDSYFDAEKCGTFSYDQNEFLNIREYFKMLKNVGVVNFPIFLSILYCIFAIKFSFKESFLAIAAFSVFIFGSLTFLVSWMRGLGFYTQYLKIALPLSCIFIGMQNDWLLNSVLAVNIIWFLRCNLKYLRYTQGQDNTRSKDLEDTSKVLDRVKVNLVMGIPNNLCDFLGYRLRKPVLWGAHGHAVKDCQDILPCLSSKISELCDKYSVSHIVVENNYFDFEDTEILENKVLYQNTNFTIFERTGGLSQKL